MIEAALDVGPREELDQLPRFLRVRGALEDDEAGAAGVRHSRGCTLWSRQRRGRPRVLHVGRQTPLELADVPWSSDPHGERAARELLICIRNVVVAGDWCEPVAKETDVELVRAAIWRILERAVP